MKIEKIKKVKMKGDIRIELEDASWVEVLGSHNHLEQAVDTEGTSV